MSPTQTVFESTLAFIKTALAARTISKTLVVGLNGPQGSGKTTLASALTRALSLDPYNYNAVALSVDDLYLTHDEQLQLTKSQNPLLEHRGLFGTHDVNLGMQVLTSIVYGSNNMNASNEISIPVFDKSLHQGEGDRVHPSRFKNCHLPIDIVIFEGWFLGFKSLPRDLLLKIYTDLNNSQFKFNHISQVNENLRAYDRDWYPFIDCFIHLVAQDISYVEDWRWQQEESMRIKSNDVAIGMGREQVCAFVAKFMPMYRIYLPALMDGFRNQQIQIIIDQERNIIDVKISNT